MSQHDFNIANQGFPSFRSDLNNALTALASNSSGDTPPSTTYANQFWYETDTNTLYFRNEDNDAWITLAVFDQTNDEWEVRTAVVQAVDSAGVAIKTDDGTTRLTIANDGTVTVANNLAVTGTTTLTDDLNVDSGTLFVDASENRVGVGTASPAESFHIVGDQRLQGTLDIQTAEPFTSLKIIPATAIGSNRLNKISAINTTVLSFETAGSERVQIDINGNLRFNSGYGSAATGYGCRAWVNFNGTGTVAIRNSGNVSSITDNGTGDYSVNFGTAMPDVNYSLVATAGKGSSALFVGSFGRFVMAPAVAPTTSAIRVEVGSPANSAGSGAFNDAEYVYISIFR